MKIEIKPLVWDRDISAVGIGGHYVAQRSARPGGEGTYVIHLWGSDDVPLWSSGFFETLEGAIAKANAHYEKCMFRLIAVTP